MEDWIKQLDDWCYQNADCNLNAWVTANYRDPELSTQFINYLGEIIEERRGREVSFQSLHIRLLGLHFSQILRIAKRFDVLEEQLGQPIQFSQPMREKIFNKARDEDRLDELVQMMIEAEAENVKEIK